MLRRLMLYLTVLAIVVVPVTMTCWKIVQYSRVSKAQVFDLHHHIAHTLAVNTTAYFNQLNMRLAFAPLLTRAHGWAEQLAVLNNALMSNNDFACASVLDEGGKEKVKAHDGSLEFLRTPLDYSANPMFLKGQIARIADTGPVYERGGVSFFDILYPLENGQWLLIVVRWDALKKLLFEERVGEKGFIWVIDEKGRVVADSQQDHVGHIFQDWDFFKARMENPEDWRGEFEDPIHVATVGASAWVKGAGWMILSAQPQSEAYAKATQLRRSAFFWMAFSFLGMVLFAYFWVKFISLPITKLAEGVRKVAHRQFDEKIPEDFGLDEFRQLGSAFNNMMKELKVYEGLQVERIIEENTKVQSLLYSIRDGIIMIGDSGGLLFANDPGKQWAIEVAGRGKGFDYAWEQLQQYPPWSDMLEPVLSQAKVSASEEFEFPVSGRSRWARVMAQHVTTEKGRLLGTMVVIRDVTQDKELDKMKEDFFNGITHDLRTPLAATIGYLGLSEMQVSPDDKELGQLVGSARQSAKRALSLVETILSLARLQAGKLAINPVPVQVQPLVNKIASDLAFQAQAKKIKLSAECEDATLWAKADQSLMERVVENITGNAIKYTMEGGWVKISAKAVDTGVQISVTDNGRGIPKEALNKLFGKFQQVKSEDRAVGFGIGLSFSKGIVEAHGSTITVESEVGKGSNFSFILEKVEAPAQSNPAKAA
jgi:signal transduction histidine kinase/HAMP domain-containing protein